MKKTYRNRREVDVELVYRNGIVPGTEWAEKNRYAGYGDYPDNPYGPNGEWACTCQECQDLDAEEALVTPEDS